MIENGCTQEEINSFIDGLYDWDKGGSGAESALSSSVAIDLFVRLPDGK